jgi:predicted dinucleotide-binding enzyme
MKIGIIGTGNIGGTLARRFRRLGHEVYVANSRGPESLTGLVAETGAIPVTVKEAARSGEVVIVAIPQNRIPYLPRDFFRGVPDDVIVVDTGNYYPELRDGRIDAIEQGALDSEWVAQQLGRSVIKAFNNIYAKSLLENGAPRGTLGRIALSVMGDSVAGKATVLRLVDELGFDPVDGGALDDSWRQQPGTPAYCQDVDAAVLRRALAEADRSKIAKYRAQAEDRARKYVASVDSNTLRESMLLPSSAGDRR